jgi:hypothetical protein
MAIGGIAAGFAGAYYCNRHDGAEKEKKEAIKIIQDEIEKQKTKVKKDVKTLDLG